MGFFGGMASTLGPVIVAKKKRQHDEELEKHREQIEFYTKISQRPDLKPNEMAMILKSLGDLAQNDPTSKKGKKGEQNILHQLSDIVGGLKSEETPSSQMIKETPVKGKELFESAYNKKKVDIPKRKSAFYSSPEMGQKRLEEEGPLKGFEVEQAIKKAQEIEGERQANRMELAKYNADRREKISKNIIEAKQKGDLPKLASYYMAKAELDGEPITQKEAEGLAATSLLQDIKDKHTKVTDYTKNIESLIKTREGDLLVKQKTLADKLVRTQIYAKSVDFRQHHQRIKEVYDAAMKDKASARTEIDALMGTKLKLMEDAEKMTKDNPNGAKAIKESINSIDEKIGEAQQRYNNAADMIQQAVEGTDKLIEVAEGKAALEPSKPPGKGKGATGKDHPTVGKIMTTKDGKKIRVKKVENGQVTDYDEVP